MGYAQQTVGTVVTFDVSANNNDTWLLCSPNTGYRICVDLASAVVKSHATSIPLKLWLHSLRFVCSESTNFMRLLYSFLFYSLVYVHKPAGANIWNMILRRNLFE